MIIRDALKKDLPECERIIQIPELKFCNNGYPNNYFLHNYLEKDYFLVAEENNKIIGFILGEKLKSDYIIIWYLAVDKNHRGNGIGSRLLDEYEKRAKANGFKWAMLQSHLDSKKNMEFYQKKEYHRGKSFVDYAKFL